MRELELHIFDRSIGELDPDRLVSSREDIELCLCFSITHLLFCECIIHLTVCIGHEYHFIELYSDTQRWSYKIDIAISSIFLASESVDIFFLSFYVHEIDILCFELKIISIGRRFELYGSHSCHIISPCFIPVSCFDESTC